MKTYIFVPILALLCGCMSVQQKNAALIQAANRGDIPKVSKLLDDHANINARDWLGDTPLHISIYRGNNELTSLLRSRGADESVLNRYGLNPADMQSLPEVEAKVVEAAQLLSPDGQWTDYTKASSLYYELKKRQDKYLVNALVLQVIRGGNMRLRVLLLAIKLGVPGSEQKLDALLMVYGDKWMAEDYLNSGSDLLHESGVRWSNSHGYYIQTGAGSHRSAWGSF